MTFPDENEISLTPECKDLLERLLNKDPSKRLGNQSGSREIKLHPFFKDVDWVQISQRKAEVPAAYLSEMALDIIAKQPFMLKDHPKVHGDYCPAGHPMYIEGWELNMTTWQAVKLNMQRI